MRPKLCRTLHAQSIFECGVINGWMCVGGLPKCCLHNNSRYVKQLGSECNLQEQTIKLHYYTVVIARPNSNVFYNLFNLVISAKFTVRLIALKLHEGK